MWEDSDAGELLLTDAEPALHRRVAVSGPQRPAVGGRRGEVPGVDIGLGVGRAQRCVSSVRQRMVRLRPLRGSPSIKEGPYQDRPPLCPFRLLPLLIYSGSRIAFLKILKVQGPKAKNIENTILLQP